MPLNILYVCGDRSLIILYIVHKLYLAYYFWLVLDLFCFHNLVALSYSVKVAEEFPFIPSGYEMASKILAWWYFYPPLALH